MIGAPEETVSVAKPAASLAPTRIRHVLKTRLVRVVRTERLSPFLVRVTLTGDDLDDFVSASFDDHIKVFFPEPGQDRPVLPKVGPNGPVFEAGAAKPVARDYTPRAYRRAALELDIEFVLHGDGRASNWARAAQPGQLLGIGGPRGSFVIPEGYDWLLVIGDATALPAIGRLLEELPPTQRVNALLALEDPKERIALQTQASAAIDWIIKEPGQTSVAEQLWQAVRTLAIPDGEGYVWAAGESELIQRTRAILVGERGIAKSRIRAASYWKKGHSATHETFEE